MAKIIIEEYPINGNGFEYLGVHYNCQFAIESDIELIIREAEISHKDTFEELYDKDSLRPDKVKLFTDGSNVPIYGMITYIIDNKKENYSRLACGNYYPINDFRLEPHPFQASICW
jgi:hypothetical protein